MGKRNHTFRSKLTSYFITMLLLIMVMAVAGFICIQVLKNTSDKIVTEYHELNALHQLKYSKDQLVAAASNHIAFQQPDRPDLMLSMNRIKDHIASCQDVLSSSHNRSLLQVFEHDLSALKVFADSLLQHRRADPSGHTQMVLMVTRLNTLSVAADSSIHTLLKETEEEISQYIKINKTASKHCTFTILILSLLLLSTSFYGGNRFIRGITQSVSRLISFTNDVANGNLHAKTDITFGNDLDLLAISFNRMVENLDKTTISRNYFQNIIESMFDMMIVADPEGRIAMVNRAVLNLVGYREDEITGTRLSEIFTKAHGTENNSPGETVHRELPGLKQKSEGQIETKTGSTIPVIYTDSIFRNENGHILGTIFVAKDISAKILIEQELEKVRRERLNAIAEAQEEERLRMAIELHDGLGQILTAICYDLENHFTDTSSGEPGQNGNKQLFNNLHYKLNQAIQETKTIAHNLTPILLKDFGLEVALKKLVTQSGRDERIHFKVETYNYIERVNPNLEKALYRIAQEGINNIIKHSNAKEAIIQLIQHEDSIVLVIEDDGAGFSPDDLTDSTTCKGIGLISMKERVYAYNGVISINSKINNGTEILVEIPC